MKLIKNLLYFSMRSLARLSLARKKPYIIGITGSVGKTSCRMIITEVLQQQLPGLKIYTSPSNYNSELGLALSVLAIENFSHSVMGWIKALTTGFLRALQGCPYDVLMLEYGIDFPGEMEIELSIIKPNTAIFTSVDSVHAHQLGSKEGILTEKSKLLRAASDIITYPIQSDYIQPYIYESNADKIIYSLEMGILGTDCGWDAHHFIVDGEVHAVFDVYLGSETTQITTNLLGREHASYISLALQLTQIIAIRKQKSWKLSKYINIQGVLQPGRYTVFQGVGESVLIDSSYNGAPQSMRMMLENTLRLRQECYPDRSLRLVLGEMRELGDFCKDEHELFATYISTLDVEKYFLVGESMRIYALPILEQAGKDVVRNVSSRELGRVMKKTLTGLSPLDKDRRQLGEILQKSVIHNPLILFKGSQNTIFLEETVKQLLINSEDEKLLCRQSKEWMGKKEKWFSSIEK